MAVRLRGRRALCYAAALTVVRVAEGCSCVPGFVPAGQPYLSPAEEYGKFPVLFVAETVEVLPGTECGRSRWGAPPFAEREPPGEPQACPLHDERYMQCQHPHIARLLVLEGLAGVEAGSYVEQRCTLQSCGDCAPPCPRVGERFLDANQSSHICRLKRCHFDSASWGAGNCSRLLERLRSPPRHAAAVAIVPLPVSFAVLQENEYLRSALLRAIVHDLEEALLSPQAGDVQSTAALLSSHGSELQRVDILEDASKTISVASAAGAAETRASLLQVHIQTYREEDMSAASARLAALSGGGPVAQAAQGAVRLQRSSDYLAGQCRTRPCHACSTTCVESSFEGLLVRELHLEGSIGTLVKPEAVTH